MKFVHVAICSLLLVVCSRAALQEALSGAGSTFAGPIYGKWISSFESQRPGLRVTYKADGSEAGVQALKQGEVDFAASDSPPASSEQDAGLRRVPTVVGAAVPAYNLPDIKRELRFTPELLADIYLGKVRKWNDAEIKALNRSEKLPEQEIALLHRSDASGTSYLWSDFLSRASAAWREKAGTSLTPNWPAGQGVEGNEGMADRIEKTPYSLGYVELIYALRHHLSYGSVQNADGKFVVADIDTVTAAAAHSAHGESIVNAPGENSYPIASFTWFLVRTDMPAGPKRERLSVFLDWTLSQGQKQAAALGYVAVPEDLAASERMAAASLWTK